MAASKVIEFLQNYRTHPDAHKVVSAVLADFIESMIWCGELTSWTIALAGGGDGARIAIADAVEISMTARSERHSTGERYSIGRLLAPRDEAVDLDDAAWEAALRLTRDLKKENGRQAEEDMDVPSGPAIRRIRGSGAVGVEPRPDMALLLLYVLDPGKSELEFAADVEGIAAFGISFPGSKSGVKVEYKVTNLYWEQEFGSAE